MHIINMSMLIFSIQCVIGHDDVAVVIVVKAAGYVKKEKDNGID